MKIILIRHGKTFGNVLKKYIGITDESLCSEGIELLKNKKYPICDLVICSPLKRCIQTAEIIYPDHDIKIYNDLRECNFGDFENKNYTELSENPYYQEWIDSGGTLPFPNGESSEKFKKRSVNAFFKAVNDNKFCNSIAFIVHGGTIMSIMENLFNKNFYDFQVKNGEAFVVDYTNNNAKILLKF